MSGIRLLRTANFRLTALYAVLFSISSLIVFGIIYWVATGNLQQQMATTIMAEISVLEQEYSVGAETELTREIGQRIDSGAHAFSFYLLQDQSGRKLAGNLPPMAPFEGWLETTVPHPSISENDGDITKIRSHKALVRGERLDGGAFIAVGISTYQGDKFKELIREAFFWAMGVVLALAFGGGSILSVGFLRRIDDISRTARAIIEGHLSERIRTSGTNDELDRLAVNLNDMLDRIQGLMESLQQVSSSIAHDLRTPLGRLRQRLEAAGRDARSPEDYRTTIGQALADTDAILATFGALLRVAQIESRTRRSSFRRIDLSAVFQNVAEVYGPVGEDSAKRIETAIASGIVIDGDQELLVQLLANLVENALTHTPPETTIRISLAQTSSGPVGILSDDGPGIPEEDRQKIFERFYRLDTSRTTPGNGLGLALVKAVADLHGASVTVTDNHPGAVFTVRFKGIPD